MPLTRAQEEFLAPGISGIYFLMLDGTKTVRCRVSHEALVDRGSATGLDETQVFETCRGEIEAAASAKYDRGDLDSDGNVVVTSNEFPPRP